MDDQSGYALSRQVDKKFKSLTESFTVKGQSLSQTVIEVQQMAQTLNADTKHEEEITNLLRQKEDLENSKKNSDSAFTALENSLLGLQEKVDITRHGIVVCNDEITALQDEIMQARKELSEVEEELGLTDQKLRKAELDLKQLEGQEHQMKGDLYDQLNKSEVVRKSIEEKRQELVHRASEMELCFEDLAQLSLPSFRTVIMSVSFKDLSPEIRESWLICYAKKHIPGISRFNQKPTLSSSSASGIEQRELLETITSNLPSEKSANSETTRFLFRLLRTSIILNASETCRVLLERKIGSQLEQVTLNDLLVPSYSYLTETLYDVDLVERLLSHFLDTLEQGDRRSSSLILVGKLIDGYLAEIASDTILNSEKFYNLLISLPNQARLYDDGIYRAVDVYLKAHPLISEAEREKICGVMDCQKNTLEACTHAVQNDRLPLRAVVRVVLFQQLQLRHAIARTRLAAQSPSLSQSTELRQSATTARRNLTIAEEDGDDENKQGEGQVNAGKWRTIVRANQMLRLDMDTMRTRLHGLEREFSNIMKVIMEIDKEGSSTTDTARSKFGSATRTRQQQWLIIDKVNDSTLSNKP